MTWPHPQPHNFLHNNIFPHLFVPPRTQLYIATETKKERKKTHQLLSFPLNCYWQFSGGTFFTLLLLLFRTKALNAFQLPILWFCNGNRWSINSRSFCVFFFLNITWCVWVCVCALVCSRTTTTQCFVASLERTTDFHLKIMKQCEGQRYYYGGCEQGDYGG